MNTGRSVKMGVMIMLIASNIARLSDGPTWMVVWRWGLVIAAASVLVWEGVQMRREGSNSSGHAR